MSGFVNLKLINRYSIYAESTGGFSVIKQAGDSNGDAGNEDYVSDEVGNTNFHTYADAVDALRFDLDKCRRLPKPRVGTAVPCRE